MGKDISRKLYEDLFLATKYDPKNIEGNIQYFLRDTLRRTNKIFEYERLPDTIKARDLELLNQTAGFSVWLPYNGKLYALYSSIGGKMDQNQEPTRAIGANAYLSYSWDLEIDKECVVMKNDAVRLGLVPTITKYGFFLAHNELSLYMLEIVSRAQKILTASDDENITSAKKWIEGLQRGDIGVVADPKFFEDMAGLHSVDFGHLNNNDIINNIELEQYLKGSLLSELGLRAPFNMKREALGDSEITQADMTILPLIDDMLAERKDALERINAMFGTDIEVKLSGAWEEIHEEIREEIEDMDEETTDDEQESTEEENTEEEEEEEDDEETKDD